MSIVGIRRSGSRALLVEFADLRSVLAFHGQLKTKPLPGQVDAVSAAATVLVKFSSATHTKEAADLIPDLEFASSLHTNSGRLVTIEVVYDGQDLEEVGRLTGLGADGVVAEHTGQLWTGAFSGFAPGFTYLVGENHTLDVPRQQTPRTSVPAGAVALGGTFSAVYPRKSPGGWQLIGRTDAVMWDLARESPALVRPGDTVRYVAVRDVVSVQGEDREGQRAAMPSSRESKDPHVDGWPKDAPDSFGVRVKSPGLQSLIQDLGRPGYGDLGVSISGAADGRAARQANRLVGNEAGAAVIENLMGGLVVSAQGDQVLAVTGAHTTLEIRGSNQATLRTAALCEPFALLDGESLHLGPTTVGVRAYVAIRGGLDVPQVLGSRSTDSMSGIGPAPLDPETFLHVAPTPGVKPVGWNEPPTVDEAPEAALRIILGPREDWFSEAGVQDLINQRWLVTEQSNRVGVRLAPVAVSAEVGMSAQPGKALKRSHGGELPSEGAVNGALQVPPSGHPVLFLADHPTTGGYPVIAVVVTEDLPSAAQLSPGHLVSFTIVDPETLKPIEQNRPCVSAIRGTVSEGTQR
jgi:KipI family sensor histidine kinase inhibitor